MFRDNAMRGLNREISAKLSKFGKTMRRNISFLFGLREHHHRFIFSQNTRLLHSLSSDSTRPIDEEAVLVQNIIDSRRQKSTDEIEQALTRSGFELTEELVLKVLHRHLSDWQPAYAFFNWVRKKPEFLLGSQPYNTVLDILGKMRRFEELRQVFDEMSERKGLLNEVTYGVLLNRYTAAHMVDEAIGVFKRRKEFGFGLELDLLAFQTLLMWLCRYKHVEVAENLFYTFSKQHELVYSDIKTWNIILNGWCVRGNVHEAKRFWREIMASRCHPDLFTCGIFINALTKKGKLGTALKLFRAMWGYNRCNPDVTICNSIINALCFKKRIPEALQVFEEMNERGCQPNAATYNTLIKYLCNIRRMEKVYEFVDEMERKQGDCLPNHVTYSFLLKSLKRPEEVPALLERMERNGCGMVGDIYNLLLKLFMDWGCEDRVMHTWNEMERSGLGPDQRSYTVMIHGYCDRKRRDDALRYYREMISKGLQLEPRTEKLVGSLNLSFEEKNSCIG